MRLQRARRCGTMAHERKRSRRPASSRRASGAERRRDDGGGVAHGCVSGLGQAVLDQVARDQQLLDTAMAGAVGQAHGVEQPIDVVAIKAPLPRAVTPVPQVQGLGDRRCLGRHSHRRWF
mgnify:CR=1 FL=1